MTLLSSTTTEKKSILRLSSFPATCESDPIVKNLLFYKKNEENVIIGNVGRPENGIIEQ